MKNKLLAIVLVAGCLSTHVEPPGPTASPVRRDSELCHTTGDRLALVVCRSQHDLAWTVTNKTDSALWVFVAPPSFTRSPARENAFVEAKGTGILLLRKFQLPPPMDEPIMTGAIALDPGASDSGVVPLGESFDVHASNFFPLSFPGPDRITTVTLEVGFMMRLPTDNPIRHDEFYLFGSVGRARQELVRSLPLSWR